LLLDCGAMSTPTRFAHDDVVTITATGETGAVKGVRQAHDGYIYQVQLEENAKMVDVPDDGLKLVTIANDHETGFAIRYIS
jgi:hypothetical protein